MKAIRACAAVDTLQEHQGGMFSSIKMAPCSSGITEPRAEWSLHNNERMRHSVRHHRLVLFIFLPCIVLGCASLPFRPLEHSRLPNLASLAAAHTPEQCAPMDSAVGVTAPGISRDVFPKPVLLKPLQAIQSRIPGVIDEKLGLLMRHLAMTPLQQIDLAPHINALNQLPRIVRELHSTLLVQEQVVAHPSPFDRLFLAYSSAYFGAVHVTPTAEGTHGVEARLQAETGFTDRNGIVHVFPGLSAAVWLSSDQQVRSRADRVDSKQITSDLIRIFLEAYFDAAFMVPAAPTATAFTVSFDEGHAQAPAGYPKLDDARLSQRDVTNLTEAALRAEAVVTSAMGEAIRGGTIASLNNETLAAGVETAAGVIAKKLVERQLFCYLAAKMEGPVGPGLSYEKTKSLSLP